MKKTILLATIIAGTMAATAGENTLTVNTPPAQPAPAAQPTAFALELAATANFATHNILNVPTPLNTAVNTYGLDLTGVWSLTNEHALTLRFGYAHGERSVTLNNVEEDMTWTDKVYYKADTFYLMPGYRYTVNLTDKLNLFAGANIGVIYHNMNAKDRFNFGSGPNATSGMFSVRSSEWGFAYSAELGLTYDLCENTYLLAAYQFSGSTAKPTFSQDDISISSHKQCYNSARVGIGFRF